MVHTSITTTLVTAAVSFVAFSSVASAQTTASIISPTQWCMFLPPQANEDIGGHEDSAIAFCTKDALGQVTGATAFPDNFILSANYNKTDSYVQVTGQLNPSLYLIPTDDGGQFDSEGAPLNAICTGYPSFVNLVEPSSGRFCIRCCNSRTTDPTNKNSCLFNHSKQGCEVVIPGDYSGPGIPSGTAVPPPVSLSLSSSSSSSSSSTPSSSSSSSSSSPSSPSSSSLKSSSSLSTSSSPTSTKTPNAAGRTAASAIGALLAVSLAALLM